MTGDREHPSIDAFDGQIGRLPDEARQALAEGIPHLKRLGRPEEFAALVRHVVENPSLNGETIRLDGALRMPPR